MVFITIWLNLMTLAAIPHADPFESENYFAHQEQIQSMKLSYYMPCCVDENPKFCKPERTSGAFINKSQSKPVR